MRRSASLCLSLLAFCAASQAAAQDADLPAESSSFSIRGFGTLGVARSSTDQSEFVRSLSQSGGATKEWTTKPDTILGLQANYRINEHWEAITQIISTYHAQSTYAPEVHWALLRYSPNAYTTLRAGRIGVELFMLADSRHVGYSQLTLRPDVNYYGALPVHYVDGGDVELRTPLGAGLLKTKLYAGYAQEKVPLGNQLWRLDRSVMAGGYVDYQIDAWQWRAGYSQITFDDNLPISTLSNSLINAGATAAAQRIALKDTTTRYYSLGGVYDSGKTIIHLMLNRSEHESSIFENTQGALALFGYRIDAFTPYISYSKIKSPHKSADTGLPNVGALATLNNTYRSALQDSHANQHTTTLGVRWDVRPNVALKAQLDILRGSPDSILLTRSDRAGYNGRMNIIGFGLDFIF